MMLYGETLGTLKHAFFGTYDELFVDKFIDRAHSNYPHTDNICWISDDSYTDNSIVDDYWFMSRREFDNSILANALIPIDCWLDDDTETILVVMLKEDKR